MAGDSDLDCAGRNLDVLILVYGGGELAQRNFHLCTGEVRTKYHGGGARQSRGPEAGRDSTTFLASGVGVILGGLEVAAVTAVRCMCHRREEGRKLYAATPRAAAPMPARDMDLGVTMQCYYLYQSSNANVTARGRTPRL